jgi:hypothetical protein
MQLVSYIENYKNEGGANCLANLTRMKCLIIEVIQTLNHQIVLKVVGFEILATAVLKSSIFWNIMSRYPLELHRRFGGTFYIHASCCLVAKLILRP